MCHPNLTQTLTKKKKKIDPNNIENCAIQCLSSIHSSFYRFFFFLKKNNNLKELKLFFVFLFKYIIQ
jgi:hypothetical protein